MSMAYIIMIFLSKVLVSFTTFCGALAVFSPTTTKSFGIKSNLLRVIVAIICAGILCHMASRNIYVENFYAK